MRELLIVVDMQNDFLTGALGTPEGQAVLPGVTALARDWAGELVFTRDTHTPDYLNTQEGKNLPVVHCVQGTEGWQLALELDALARERGCRVFDKPTFGSTRLAHWAATEHAREPFDRISLAGVCTDICVLSNALLLKAALPEVPVRVYGSLCAGVSPASHTRALEAMQVCQVEVV